MKKNLKDLKKFDVTMINVEEKNLTKKSLLEKLEASLNEFTYKDILSEVNLRAVIRVSIITNKKRI